MADNREACFAELAQMYKGLTGKELPTTPQDLLTEIGRMSGEESALVKLFQSSTKDNSRMTEKDFDEAREFLQTFRSNLSNLDVDAVDELVRFGDKVCGIPFSTALRTAFALQENPE